jgi:hypothetical protein
MRVDFFILFSPRQGGEEEEAELIFHSQFRELLRSLRFCIHFRLFAYLNSNEGVYSQDEILELKNGRTRNSNTHY